MILAILQARMSSTRLPGKVLMDMLGEPMMMRQIERISRSRRIDRLVVATSDSPSDDAIESACRLREIPVYRGSLTDVLARFCGAERAFGPADHVVRLTADCPVADWQVIDACIDLHLQSGADYTTNGVERTYPDGLDVEAVKGPVLRAIGQEATAPQEREHVTPFIYRNPQRFKIRHLKREPSLSHLRWTVDQQADFELVETFYRSLYALNPDFRTDEILALIASRPELATFNQSAAKAES